MAKEKEIKENEITMGLMKAESEYGAFVNSVFNLISATIQGQDSAQGGCDPSCCAGCSVADAAGGEKLKLLLRTRTWYHRQPASLGQKL